MTKRIYLDVDGVLNAFPGEFEQIQLAGWSDDSWCFEYIDHHGQSFGITWSDELVNELNNMQAQGVEFRWLTTWCELAQKLLAPVLELEGGEFWPLTADVTYATHRYAFFSPLGRHYWWKQASIITDLTDDPAEKSVWVDDDHGFYDSRGNRWTQERIAGDELLVVDPTTTTGLSVTDIKTIKEFLDVE